MRRAAEPPRGVSRGGGGRQPVSGDGGDFAGILHGLDNPQLPLQEEVEGNGLEQEGLPFPIRQSDALWEFMQNDHLRERLGERFCHVFHACKHDELLQFERLITETEIEWMLKNA